MTLVIGGALSLTNQVLKPAQTRSIELDTKTQILRAVREIQKGDDILGIYNGSIESLVVDYQGSLIELDDKGNPIIAEKVNILRNFKKSSDQREYPVYKYKDESGSVSAYIFPVYGNGLWNNIYGYLALESDLNTVKGVSYGHVQETPGLGARIADKEVQERYVGKKIFDESGNLVSIKMLKGEKGDPSLFGPHEVDGMSGATLTAKGVNAMLDSYLTDYSAFIKQVKNQEEI
jgi:Na+-transporting NADH:ubiquinone oxidoreductase subunit C